MQTELKELFDVTSLTPVPRTSYSGRSATLLKDAVQQDCLEKSSSAPSAPATDHCYACDPGPERSGSRITGSFSGTARR
eukprot:6172046-Pleurochrysis_carterae.AAC.4